MIKQDHFLAQYAPQLYPYYAVKDKLTAKHFASPAISAPEKSNEESSRWLLFKAIVPL